MRCSLPGCGYRFALADYWARNVFGVVLCLACAVELAGIDPEGSANTPAADTLQTRRTRTANGRRPRRPTRAERLSARDRLVLEGKAFLLRAGAR